MPLATTTVIGPVLLPSGAAPASGYLRFILDGYETDAGQVVAPSSVRVDIGAGGAFSAALWPNARGARGTRYAVLLGLLTGSTPVREVSLGTISVPESITPVKLEDLLGLPVLPGYTQTVVLTQAEYDALVSPDPQTLYLIEG